MRILAALVLALALAGCGADEITTAPIDTGAADAGADAGSDATVMRKLPGCLQTPDGAIIGCEDGATRPETN